MPGFLISNTSTQAQSGAYARLVPDSNSDWIREHRYRLIRLLNIDMINAENNGEFLHLKEVSLPTKSIKRTDVETAATTYKFAKKGEYSDLELTFYGSRLLYEKILALHDRAHSITTGPGDYNLYKGQVELLVYESYANGRLQTGPDDGLRYVFENAWVADVDHGNLTFTSSEIKTITVTVSIDYYEVFSGGKLITGNSDSEVEVSRRILEGESA